MVERKPQIEPKKAKFPKRLCKGCGKEFQAKRRWHDFCSRNCRIIFWKESNSDPHKIAELEKRLKKLESILKGLRDEGEK